MKVLIIRFSSIGDIVLTSPVIRCVRQQKAAELYYLTKAAYADIPAANPLVSRVFALGKPNPNSLFSDKIQYFDSLTQASTVLKQLRLNAVVDLHNNLRSWMVRLKLGVTTFTFQKMNIEKWLLVRFKINALPKKHVVDRYLEAVKPLGVLPDDAGLDFPIPDKEISNTAEMLEAAFGIQTGTAFIAFVIGATHSTKRLPIDKISAICNKIKMPVLLVGGPNEADCALQIINSGSGNIQSTCGKLNLFQSAEVVKRAQIVITHDTGLMHIAAALHQRIVSVWGSTVPEFGMYPFYPKGMDRNSAVEVSGLSCRPCSKIGYDHCPKGHFKCMNLQSVDQIIAQLPV